MKACVNGVTLAYESHGTGPAVVLVHDFPLSRRMWAPQIPALVAAGYRVILPDLRGFGDSRAPEEPWTMAEAADDIVSLMSYLGIGRAVVCGSGMGGSVLLEMILRHRRRMAAACFFSSQAKGDSGAEKVWRSELADLVSKGHQMAVAQTFAPLYLSQKTARDQPGLLDQVCEWMAATSPEGLVSGLMALRGRPDYTYLLSRFDLPVLVISGEHDRVTPAERSFELASALPRCQSLTLPAAGHLLNLERPQEVNPALLDFLHELSVRKPAAKVIRKVA